MAYLKLYEEAAASFTSSNQQAVHVSILCTCIPLRQYKSSSVRRPKVTIPFRSEDMCKEVMSITAGGAQVRSLLSSLGPPVHCYVSSSHQADQVPALYSTLESPVPSQKVKRDNEPRPPGYRICR